MQRATIIRSFEPGEDWGWCYIDQVELEFARSLVQSQAGKKHMQQQILVPLDGSALAESILPYAGALARATASTLKLLQVEPPPLVDMGGNGMTSILILGCLPPLSVEETAMVSHFNFLRARGPTGSMLRQEQPGVAVPGVEKMD